MNINSTFKNIIIAAAIVAVCIAAFLIHALAGFNTKPVVFANPPAFVEQYVVEMNHSDSSSQATELKANGTYVNESEPTKLTTRFIDEEMLVHNVFFNDESPDSILRLFAHPEKAQRVKIASAFAAINVEFTHNEDSGFPEKRKQFWIDVEQHLPDIQNALFEALITSAEEGTANKIPYTLAWMPGQDHETVELLAWAAKHHPDWWVRRFSVYFVVKFGQNETLAAPLLQNLAHDPNYKVRKQVLDLRLNRLMGEI